MKRWTAAVLIGGAVLGTGVFLLGRGPRVEEAPPRSNREPPAQVAPPAARARRQEGKPGEPQAGPLPPPRPAPVPAPALTPAPLREAPRPGLIRGTVRIDGSARQRHRTRKDADPACAALHTEPPISDRLVRDRENRARWVFVCVKTGLEGRTIAPPAVPVILAQVGCRSDPHVLGSQVGQPLLIVNQDPLLHSIPALAFVNPAFSFGQPVRGLEETKRFTTPETISIRCDVHPWMNAWIGVVDHPYTAVTDAAGGYSIPDLPAGHYRIEAWHEACNAVSKEVDVAAGNGVGLDFLLDVRK